MNRWILGVVNGDREVTFRSRLCSTLNVGCADREERARSRSTRHYAATHRVWSVIYDRTALAGIVRHGNICRASNRAVCLHFEEDWVVVGSRAAKGNAVAGEDPEESSSHGLDLLIVAEHALAAGAAIGCRREEVLQDQIGRKCRSLIDAHRKVNREHRD